MLVDESKTKAPEEAQRSTKRPLWVVASAGTTIGLCIMGDSLMYSVLPLEASRLGFALPMVGILLSANRLIRLVSNTWASNTYERFGPSRPFVFSALLGFVSTALYGVGMGFAVFLTARLLWGVAWSGLRQGGYQAIWTGDSGIKGRLTGLLWGLVRLGSAVSVLFGGFLYDRYGYSTTLAVVAFLAILSIPMAMSMPWPQRVVTPYRDRVQRQRPVHLFTSFSQWRSVLNVPTTRWLTTAGFFAYLLSGVVVSTTSIFLAQRLSSDQDSLVLGAGVATVTGLLLGARWLTDLVLGPLVALLSDRLGQATIAVSVGMLLLLGLVGATALPVLAALVCLLVVLICDGALHILLSAAASGAAILTNRPNLYIAVFTTVSDAGSAAGPLIAFSAAAATGLSVFYLAVGLLLVVSLLQFWWKSRTT